MLSQRKIMTKVIIIRGRCSWPLERVILVWGVKILELLERFTIADELNVFFAKIQSQYQQLLHVSSDTNIFQNQLNASKWNKCFMKFKSNFLHSFSDSKYYFNTSVWCFLGNISEDWHRSVVNGGRRFQLGLLGCQKLRFISAVVHGECWLSLCPVRKNSQTRPGAQVSINPEHIIYVIMLVIIVGPSRDYNKNKFMVIIYGDHVNWF